MFLKLRPTGLGRGVYKDNVDYRVLNGEWGISRLDVRSYWSLHGLVLTRRPGMSAPPHVTSPAPLRHEAARTWKLALRACGQEAILVR